MVDGKQKPKEARWIPEGRGALVLVVRRKKEYLYC